MAAVSHQELVRFVCDSIVALLMPCIAIIATIATPHPAALAPSRTFYKDLLTKMRVRLLVQDVEVIKTGNIHTLGADTPCLDALQLRTEVSGLTSQVFSYGTF